MHDLVIRNGTVIDGSRRASASSPTSPSTTAASPPSGPSHDPGREELDATGLAVTPGFVDVHTHYDGQVTWDPLLTPSIWHGVTTVVMGNCGVGFAPAAARPPRLAHRPHGRRRGHPRRRRCARPSAGTGRSVGEYLDALDHIPRALDVAAQVAARRGARLRDGRARRGQRARHRRRHHPHGRARRRGRRRRRGRALGEPARAAQGGRRPRGAGHLRRPQGDLRAGASRAHVVGGRGVHHHPPGCRRRVARTCGTGRSTG